VTIVRFVYPPVAQATAAARSGRAGAKITLARTTPSLIAAARRTILEEDVSDAAAGGGA
jgi:hypothetical protein